MGLFWNDHLQSKNARRANVQARMPEGRMCKHECSKGECASTNARRANVCDDFIYGVVTITFGD